MKNMYELWFDESCPFDLLHVNKKYTQAEIGNIFSTLNKEYIFKMLS